MTSTLPGADIHGYYHHLGIELPAWASPNANVRCFADPDAHQHDDRSPSMSVNVITGAFHCHGCGAKGGASDAARRLDIPDDDVLRLLAAYGIWRPSHGGDRRWPRRAPAVTPSPSSSRRVWPRRASTPARRQPAIAQDHVVRCHRALLADPSALDALWQLRGWTVETIRALKLGVEHEQITIPVYQRPHSIELAAFLRYQPDQSMRAAPGSRRVLYPHPAAQPGRRVLLVEGEPDRIAAHSRHLPAIGVPGIDSWRPEWASLLIGRHVTVVLDSDSQGRKAARRIDADLERLGIEHEIVDLAPDRDDGYDLTDWLLTHPGHRVQVVEGLLHELAGEAMR